MKLSIRFKIISFIILPFVVISLAIMVFNIGRMQELTTANVEQRMAELATSYATRFDCYLRECELTAKLTASFIQNNPYIESERIYDQLQANLENNAFVFGSAICFEPFKYHAGQRLFVRYVFRDGDAMQRIDPSGDGYDYTELKQEYWHKPKNENKAVWTEPYFDEGGGNILMSTYSAPFFKNGKFSGVATVDISLEPLKEMLDTNAQNKFFIISRSGKYIYSPYPEQINKSIFEISKQSNRQDMIELAKKMLSGKAGVVKMPGWDPATREWLFYASIPSTQWGFAVCIPEKKVLLSVRVQLYQNIIFLVISLLLIIISLWLLSFLITRPIAQLTNTASEISKGNLYAKVDITSNDEIGTLASIFNDMVYQLSERDRSLRESEQINRELLENIPQRIFYKNKESKYVACNDNYAHDLNITTDQIAGKTDYDFYPKELAEQYRADDIRIIESGKVETIEEDYVLQGDQKFIVQTVKAPVRNEKEEIIGMLGIFMDITERKQAEEDLQVSKAFIDSIIEQSPFAIWISDTEGTLQRANRALKKYLNLTDEQLVGKYNAFRDPIAERQGLLPLFRTVYEEGKTINFTCDWDGNDIPTMDLKGSKSVSIEATMFPIHNSEGKLTNVVMSWTDVTERKQLEEKLQQSHKMESVGTLAGGVAHEFNNILGGITGYTEIAMDDAHEDRPVLESLDEILKLSNRAKDVVRQILSFSRKGKKEFKPIQPHLTIGESIKVLRATIPTTIKIKHNLDANSGTILADTTQINQVGTNLCMNAAHAMEDSGGVLEIGLFPVVLDAQDVKPYPDLETGEYVKLTVSDTGNGIDPKNIDKIFDPFFTTKRVGKGTGMGLSVTHGIIKDHGGEITVSSKLGEGTTLTVFLPKIESKSEEAKIDDAVPTGTENILVVDDEEHMVFLIKTILGRLGYNVTALTSSLDALNLFKKDPQRYDLIITDLTMPHLTGDRLASEIITIRPDMSVIIVTGYTDAVDSEKVKQSGIKAFIPKPCQKQELARTIRLILDEK